MTEQQYYQICTQRQVVKDVLDEYGDRTLENAIKTLESRIKWYEQHKKENKP